GRRQIIRDTGFCAGRDWQSEIKWPFTHHPDSGLPFAAPKKHETRHVRPHDLCGERRYLLASESLAEPRMSESALAKEIHRLLPLAFTRDVGIVTATKGEDRKCMRLVIIVMTQPAPGLIVSAR